MYKIILSVRLFHVSCGHNHDVEIMKNAIKVHVKYDVQKLINIFNKEKKGYFLILARTQELSNDIGLIAFFQFFFFSFTVIFFFIFLEDGPVQHKKKIIHSQSFSELTRLLKLIFKNSKEFDGKSTFYISQKHYTNIQKLP